MFVDALMAFLAVCVWLAITLAVLWAITKVLGYIVMLFEGEHLVPEIKAEGRMTRRRMQMRRHAYPAH
jgi:hypothetical protein